MLTGVKVFACITNNDNIIPLILRYHDLFKVTNNVPSCRDANERLGGTL